jgi:hypothetical protein
MQIPVTLKPGLHLGKVKTASIAYVIAGMENVEIDKFINNYRAWPLEEQPPFECDVCCGAQRTPSYQSSKHRRIVAGYQPPRILAEPAIPLEQLDAFLVTEETGRRFMAGEPDRVLA